MLTNNDVTGTQTLVPLSQDHVGVGTEVRGQGSVLAGLFVLQQQIVKLTREGGREPRIQSVAGCPQMATPQPHAVRPLAAVAPFAPPTFYLFLCTNKLIYPPIEVIVYSYAKYKKLFSLYA